MLYRFLTEDDERILQAERHQLVTLRHPLATLDADSDDMAQLDRAILQLDELFLLVVVGEFNAGKTAFLNAMLGERCSPEGVPPTTTQIPILVTAKDRRTDEAAVQHCALLYLAGQLVARHQPCRYPRHQRHHPRHQELTQQFVPRSDLVLFVTSRGPPVHRE